MESPIILIVEDEPLIASLLTQILRTGGYQVLYARSGEEALGHGRLFQEQIALVLCDVTLPDQPGNQVAARLKELCPRTKILFTSGYPLDILTARGLLTPANLQDDDTFYIPKPFRPKELVQFVDSILSFQRPVAAAGMVQGEAAHAIATH